MTNTQIIKQWNSRVQAQVDEGHTRAEATRNIAVGDPAFHRKYLAAFNEEHRAGRKPARR